MILSYNRICSYLYEKRRLLIAILAAFVVLTYLAASTRVDQIGFPLDDAWIHQTYARNLARYGEWSFISGQPSAGSTSPLWTGLLAPGYLLGISPFHWTFVLGWLMLSGLGLTGMRICRRILPSHLVGEIAVGLVLVTEWHLVWAAVSGMETLLFALLILLVLEGSVKEHPSWLLEGLMVGASIWIRPDGVTLAGPLLLIVLLRQPSWKYRLMTGVKFLLGIVLLAIPYLFFNLALSGAWWPNTFFAKQAEYSVLQQMPVWFRFLRESVMMLVGVGAILVPGFFILCIRSIRLRDWEILVWLIWLLGFILIYSLRLPVTYQHGRYIIPAMPVYFLMSSIGFLSWFKVKEPAFLLRVIGRVWVVSCSFVLWGFLILGARTYANDVALINSEMVAASHWIAENTEENAIVAAHDIGALGFFGNRQILDLAGIITPEVIPIIRDESGIMSFLDKNAVDYLMTFPAWYPKLVKMSSPLFCTNGIFSPVQGGENMCIYRWR